MGSPAAAASTYAWGGQQRIFLVPGSCRCSPSTPPQRQSWNDLAACPISHLAVLHCAEAAITASWPRGVPHCRGEVERGQLGVKNWSGVAGAITLAPAVKAKQKEKKKQHQEKISHRARGAWRELLQPPGRRGEGPLAMLFVTCSLCPRRGSRQGAGRGPEAWC